MLNLAVDLFLSLDIAGHNRELYGDLVLGNPDQARDAGGRWARIEDAMSVAREGITKALAGGKPKGSFLKEPEKIHDTVRHASAVAAASGSVKSHKDAAKAAWSAANKTEVLVSDHARAGNKAEAQAAQEAVKAYKDIARHHSATAVAGGDSSPHGALMTNTPVRRRMDSSAAPLKDAAVEPKPEPPAEPQPEIEYQQRPDYGAMSEDEAMALPLTDLGKYSKGYQGSMPFRGDEVKQALDELGGKSDDARAAQADFNAGKMHDIDRLMDMHADALGGIKTVTKLLEPYSGGVRWNRMMDDADYHESQLRELEKKAGPKSPRVACPAGSPEMYCSRRRHRL